MKKLIALSAAALMASSAAMAGITLSGAASVTYDDNGTAASATTTAASLTIAGSNGGTSATATLDLTDGTMHSVSMSTSIGPVSIAVDMLDEDGTTPGYAKHHTWQSFDISGDIWKANSECFCTRRRTSIISRLTCLQECVSSEHNQTQQQKSLQHIFQRKKLCCQREREDDAEHFEPRDAFAEAYHHEHEDGRRVQASRS